MTNLPEQKAGVGGGEVRQYKPAEKLKTKIDDYIRENLGVDGELVELIEIPSQIYADQIMIAQELATARFWEDANIPKSRVTQLTATGSKTTDFCPAFITQIELTGKKDGAQPKPHIAIQKRNIAKPHEFRQARNYLIEQTNKILSTFDKPQLNLKDPSELL